ncbi:glycosyl transferase [Dactylosporangium sucinum]|uniref:Glycosyl transferase n=2 Tax=Dactylosporangium sucinum TaxID=1424081 RepID=A0A917WIC7_9ACTN|nr:glycosyltransferase family 4 protein [Dactylosporangium sucinum]GGM07170.1 glycosyl transferase [Dactylosporangium sucinum]
MRIAFVLASTTGGTGRHVGMLVDGLVAHGAQVSVHGPAATDQQFRYAERGAVFVPVEIPPNPQPGDVLAVRTLRRSLKGVDVIHAHSLRAGLVAALARPAGVPLVVTWHNLVLAQGLRARLYHPLERRVARAADVTLGVSTDLVERARELGARDVRLAKVPAPVLRPPARGKDAVREELGVEPGQPLVFAAGRLHPQKGFETLVAAAARWRDRDPQPYVAIAGSGPSYMPLAQRISVEHAPVHLLGYRDDVPDLLGAADLVVATSVWEGQPLFVQETMAAGVPLVSTAVGGVPELVGSAARLVAVHDVDGIAGAVAELLDDPGAREELGRKGLAQAATWPTAEDTVEQVEAVYAQLRTRGEG